MDRRINPFNELYVTETIRSDQFVKIFSPVIVKNVEALFLPGNIVLQGVQGSGKSMLLALLKPEVRLAYKLADVPFPVPAQCSRFIGAGINLTRSGAIDFGQRQIMKATGGQADDHLPLYFGDFLNYWITYDILQSIEQIWSETSGTVARGIGVTATDEALDNFAAALREDRCWFGYLNDVGSFEQLKDRISARISHYLSFLNYNCDSIAREVQESKTSVGEPISRTSETLRTSGILADDVQIFVRIDQYEELGRLEGLHREFGPVYQTVVNKALGMRDPRVSYRIGTRRYAWQPDLLTLFGTTARLEQERNYKILDLDVILRRKENVKSWMFPALAEDIFDRRLRFAGYDTKGRDKATVQVFGRGLSPEEKASFYCRNARERAVRIEREWPEPWKAYLQVLAATDPLLARLAKAWCRQAGKSQIMWHVPAGGYPWEKKPYWRKERVDHALMQVAGRCAQRMIWAGREEILELSGGNILVFVSICQRIWAAWLRTTRGIDSEDLSLPAIEPEVQALGIHEASTHWFQKISEEESGGDTRQRFIRHLGNLFEKQMFNDAALSYPGRNGFSVKFDDLDSYPNVSRFLIDAVDYGDLFQAPHTTKEKDRGPRQKWYLNPVLSPHFRLPHTHTKEPLYVSGSEVERWIRAAESLGPETTQDAAIRPTGGRGSQGALDFGGGGSAPDAAG